MKKGILFCYFTAITFPMFAQMPFTTYNKKKIDSLQLVENSSENGQDDVDFKAHFFDHINANVVSIKEGKKLFPTINGEVLNYRLQIFNTKKGPAYLPLSIITKISGNYADSSAGPTSDATSFFGAPLTFRFSPAKELWSGNDNAFFIGLNADLRLLTFSNEENKGLETTWGTYGSLGLTYMGKGYGYETDESERHDGIWSFTAMIYAFKSGGTFNKKIFGNDYENKALAGLELFLRFKTSKKEDSKFNFLIGASNGFTPGAPNFSSWQFKLGIGN